MTAEIWDNSQLGSKWLTSERHTFHSAYYGFLKTNTSKIPRKCHTHEAQYFHATEEDEMSNKQ